MENQMQKTTFIGQSYFYEDDTSSIKIFPSGWNDKYHVIVENGEYQSVEHLVCTTASIKTLFNIDISEMPKANELIKSNPNDYDLGEEFRKIHNNLV